MDPLLVFGLNVLVYIGIFAIVAMSLNLEFGFTGLGNFGKVAFFMTGAYTYAIMSEAGLHFLLCLLGAAIVSAIFGLLISLPTLRLREDYLAIVALTFGEILRIIIKSEDWIANGVWGISVSPAIPMADAAYSTTVIVNLTLVFVCLAICFVLLQFITNSPYGRIIRAIREDDVASGFFREKSL